MTYQSLLDWNFKDEHVEPPFSSFPIGITVPLLRPEIGTGKVKCAYCRRLYPSIPEKNCGSCGAADWIEPLRYSDGGVEVEYWEKAR
jgi:hypothetical protein